jgi:hypothetical protein
MREISTKRGKGFTPALNASGLLPVRSFTQPLDNRKRDSSSPQFDHNFSQVRAHTDMRGGSAQDPFGDIDRRFGAAVEDPVHQSMLDSFREHQGQPAGGVDDMGNQVGPTDAEIKYRPQPIAVLNGPFHAPIDTAAAAGMEIQISVVMSSNNAELPFVQDSEVVSTSFDHTGSAVSMAPFTSSNSTFMSAANIPNDRHTSGRARIIDLADNHGGSGSYSRRQLDIYNHARYGIFNPLAIPNSGYKLTRSIIAGPGTSVRFRVDKTPEACTVGNFSTDAGPSPAQHDEVVVRA